MFGVLLRSYDGGLQRISQLALVIFMSFSIGNIGRPLVLGIPILKAMCEGVIAQMCD